MILLLWFDHIIKHFNNWSETCSYESWSISYSSYSQPFCILEMLNFHLNTKYQKYGTVTFSAKYYIGLNHIKLLIHVSGLPSNYFDCKTFQWKTILRKVMHHLIVFELHRRFMFWFNHDYHLSFQFIYKFCMHCNSKLTCL